MPSGSGAEIGSAAPTAGDEFTAPPPITRFPAGQATVRVLGELESVTVAWLTISTSARPAGPAGPAGP